MSLPQERPVPPALSSRLPSKTEWLDSLDQGQRLRAEKALARVNKYIEQGEIELEDDSEALLHLIVLEGVNADPRTVLDKNWAIRTALRRMHDPRLNPQTQQRCFEFACELLGMVQETKAGKAISAAVTFDANQSRREEKGQGTKTD